MRVPLVLPACHISLPIGMRQGVMDNLTYTYGSNSNQLLKVADAGNTSYGFKDNTNVGNDYSYDLTAAGRCQW